jgi:hypothetical protein
MAPENAEPQVQVLLGEPSGIRIGLMMFPAALSWHTFLNRQQIIKV